MKRVGTTLPKRTKWPIFYLSGRFDTGVDTARKEVVWMKRTGCRTRCWSYAFICPGAFYYRNRMEACYKESVAAKTHIMMDSSAYSMQQFLRKGRVENIEKYREDTIQGYIKFAADNCKNWDFYCNFDYRIHAPTVYKMQKRLEKAGLQPTPVFHGDDGLEWLRRYIDDGHRLVAIGAAPSIRRTWKDKRFYLDQVFELTERHGVLCHGLAFTSMSLAFCYPWYSVDSTTWVRYAAFGQVCFLNPLTHVLEHIHVSTRNMEKVASYNRMPKEVQKEIRTQVEGYGFDFDKLRTDIEERAVYNAWVFVHLPQLGVEAGGKGKVQWQRLL